MTNLEKAMEVCGVTQADLARALGIDRSTVCHKLAGRRPWMLEEAKAVVSYLREQGAKRLTVDTVFSDEAAA